MVTYGSQTKQDFAPIIIIATGFILIMDGPGFQITIGDGLRFTMAAGCMIMHTDGCGYLVINGRRPGFHGEAVATIMDGHPLVLVWT